MAARAQNRAAKRHGRRRTARRLVHHDDARVGDKLDGDRQALALLDGQACFLLSRAIGCVVAVVVRLLGALGVAVCCLDGTAPPPPCPLARQAPSSKQQRPLACPSLSLSLSPLSPRPPGLPTRLDRRPARSTSLKTPSTTACTWRFVARAGSRRRALVHSASSTVAAGLWMSACSQYLYILLIRRFEFWFFEWTSVWVWSVWIQRAGQMC